jgi:nucleotide-binding universal stress UspA family protein
MEPKYKPMKTILVLTDFSLRAAHAAHYALRLAQTINANLLLCNVFHVPSREANNAQVTWPAEDFALMERNSYQDLRELADSLGKQNKSDYAEGTFKPLINYCAKTGPLAEVMNEIVYSQDILMAVVSMHEGSGLNTFLLGNHTREIIDKADCPVLVVPYQAPFRAFSRIAFATDLSHNSIDVVHCLAGLAKHTNSEILITHVADQGASDAEEHAVIKKYFNQVASQVKYPNIYYRAVKSKSIVNGLDWLTENSDIDMLVLVHRKRNFLERIFEGSVTQRMADHTTTPMLVFPAARVLETLPVF